MENFSNLREFLEIPYAKLEAMNLKAAAEALSGANDLEKKYRDYLLHIKN